MSTTSLDSTPQDRDITTITTSDPPTLPNGSHSRVPSSYSRSCPRYRSVPTVVAVKTSSPPPHSPKSTPAVSVLYTLRHDRPPLPAGDDDPAHKPGSTLRPTISLLWLLRLCTDTSRRSTSKLGTRNPLLSCSLTETTTASTQAVASTTTW